MTLGREAKIQRLSQVYLLGPEVRLTFIGPGHSHLSSPGPGVTMPTNDHLCLDLRLILESERLTSWKSLCRRQVFPLAGTFSFSHHEIPGEIPLSLGSIVSIV